MVKKLQRRFALSHKGAVDTIKGSLMSALQNISFMLPVALLYYLVIDMLGGTLSSSRIPFYAIGSVLCAVIILVCTYLQYNGTFLATYVETGVRRISLAEKLRKFESQLIKTELGTAIFVVTASLILRLGIATTALVGSYLLIKCELDIITFFMFLLVVSRLYDPLEGSLQNLAAIISTNTNIERMNEILDHPVQEGDDKLTNSGCDIVFDHVGFAYDGGETVLSDVSFTAKQGEVTALVGPSGGGKTTVSRLAARFWDVNKGKITVGGMDVSKIDPETLMSLYSIVFQDVTLFDNTVMENIRLGKKDATDEEVMAAARLANVTEFVEKLPDKWNSNIGENGCELSGGERQRISIARAFLKDAPIILLDEATASLDVENETAIQTALSRLIKDKTVLIIAHRMRTVSGADKIVVLKDGHVAEQGAPEALYKQNGIFTRMLDLQTQSQNWKLEA